jgi:hypothetical protein
MSAFYCGSATLLLLLGSTACVPPPMLPSSAMLPPPSPPLVASAQASVTIAACSEPPPVPSTIASVPEPPSTRAPARVPEPTATPTPPAVRESVPAPAMPPDPPKPAAVRSTVSCGVRVRVDAVDGDRVTLVFENVSRDTIVIGASPWARFVDAHGNSMQRLTGDWFESFQLLSASRRTTTLRLSGGDPSALDRMEVDDSGKNGDCTLKVAGLSG